MNREVERSGWWQRVEVSGWLTLIGLTKLRTVASSSLSSLSLMVGAVVRNDVRELWRLRWLGRLARNQTARCVKRALNGPLRRDDWTQENKTRY